MTSSAPAQSASPWSPFRQSVYTVLWTATVVANIGTWMYSAGAGWLMTTLSTDPLVVRQCGFGRGDVVGQRGQRIVNLDDPQSFRAKH